MKHHNWKHGHSASGQKASATYESWRAMRKRCASDRPEYGGRGIKVCRRWRLFVNFLADMGERPAGKTLDRKDPNGDYNKNNCRWATPQEQSQNQRSTKLNPTTVMQIRYLCTDGGYSQRKVAKAFNVAYQTVSKVVRGQRWANV